MNQPERVLWKIIGGAILVIVTATNLTRYVGGSTQENAALALSLLVLFGGFYLIYRGLYPNSR
jgi:hypothetical protein